jgi:hypothetical protein
MKELTLTIENNTTETSLQGYMDIHYSELEDALGPPHFEDRANDNVHYQWGLKINGTTVTIYDWHSAGSKENVKHWHIGGFNSIAVARVKELFPAANITYYA